MISSEPRIAEMLRRRRVAAFTLIELLAAIAIISVLISILMPALSGARKTSRGVLCQTRMRSLGMAMMAYADTFNSVVPLSESSSMHFAAALLPGLGEGSMTVVGNYFDETGNHEPFTRILGRMVPMQCPDFPNKDQRLDFVVNGFSVPYTRGDEPGPPGTGPQTDGTDDKTEFASLTRMDESTSNWIYLTEAHTLLPTDTPWLHDLFSSAQLPLAAYPRIASDLRHPSGINALFFDTHVESMRHQRLDVGWPHPLSERLRYFTHVAE